MDEQLKKLQVQAISWLQRLISIPSISKEEAQTASYIEQIFLQEGIKTHRIGNNIISQNLHFDTNKKTILLNSHHDTVKPSPSYSMDPYATDIIDGKLYGLGSNDAGGALVSLMAIFVYYHNMSDLPFNLILVASAEEEISGSGGIEMVLPLLPNIHVGIVGEPTSMQMAVAEKGLMVLNCINRGVAGHAAREEGINAIYSALKDIAWFSSYKFAKTSPWLGPVKMSVTSINTPNKSHNVVPDNCEYVVDIRMNEMYTMEEVLHEISKHVTCDIKPRSMRLKPTSISTDHPLVLAGVKAGCQMYGSPTLSDKALMPFDTLKLGPGDSARSHTANEYIYVDQIIQGVEIYHRILEILFDNSKI